MKANPLGNLEMEVEYNAAAVISAGESEDRFRRQVPKQDSLSGADTYKVDASTPTKRADIELSRAHLGGADVKLTGADMPNDPSVKGAKEYTADPAA